MQITCDGRGADGSNRLHSAHANRSLPGISGFLVYNMEKFPTLVIWCTFSRREAG